MVHLQNKKIIALKKKVVSFHKEEGPFVRSLDAALATFNVEDKRTILEPL